MPDRGRAHGSRSRALTLEHTHQRPDPGDASAEHYWLMRRSLAEPLPAVQWPAGVSQHPLTLDRAAEAHYLLIQGYCDGAGSVPDYPAWLSAFERDPEFDLSLCFLALRDDAVVGVITCWTSAFIKDLVVHPDARAGGIGFALLNHLFSQLRGPVTRPREAAVDLHVMENNLTARWLYEKSVMSYVKRFNAPVR
ncbi:Acetyltransferase [Pseudomonas syringae pv. maculicola]|uniref:Acetyltransferase, GNAT family n=2 Tax=Pseudomonas syringae group genomosp. 3 TaxID=251701 RepID=A0A0N1JK17_PSEYM|nr:Acetyltransferase [Pseudomonas syringae pv. maculicola]RMV37702.1 Acetyltransferase, GNAT family [Pseudomonas syringae pv. maculicola]